MTCSTCHDPTDIIKIRKLSQSWSQSASQSVGVLGLLDTAIQIISPYNSAHVGFVSQIQEESIQFSFLFNSGHVIGKIIPVRCSRVVK